MMDWDHRSRSSCCTGQVTSTRTGITSSGVSPRTRSKLILPLATYTILLCLVPLVVCREADTEIEDTDVSPLGPRGYVDVFSDSEIHHLPHHRKHHHTINMIDDEDASNSIKEWNSGRKRKLRGRSKSMKQRTSPVDNEFDVETLDKQVSISSSPSSSSSSSSSSQPAQKRANIVNSNLKYLEPDKKYFDYFPIEDVQLNYDPKEDDIRVVLLSADDTDEDVKKKKSKKFATNSSSMKRVLSLHRRKREAEADKNAPGYDTDDKTTSDVVESEGSGITKRNAYGRHDSFLGFLESQRGNNIPQNNYDSSRHSFGYQGNGDNYYTRGTPNDPWNNRFAGPVNNFYLPVPLPFYSSSSAPVVTKLPIPGIFGNTVVPQHGYIPPQSNGIYPSRPSGFVPPQYQPQPQPQPRPQPQPQPQPRPEKRPDSAQGTPVEDRFGADEDRVVWDSSPNSARDTPQERPSITPAQSIGTVTSSTRRPPPPLIHRENRPNSNRGNRVSNTTPRSATVSRDVSLRKKQLPSSENRKRPNTKVQSINDRRIMQLTKEIFEPPTSNALGSGGFGGNFEPQPPRQNQRPPPAPASSTTGSRPPPPAINPETPSKCIWGILSCCARSNLAIRYACFEQLGCHGAFWDLNPCSDSLQDAALEEARRFFD